MSTLIGPAEYPSLLQRDFHAFVRRSFRQLRASDRFAPNWHVEALCSTLERCRRGEIRRLIINVPPRSLKSHCASIAFPAFWLGHNPSAEIACVSYGQDFANKLALDCRNVMQSAWYRNVFSTRLSPAKQAVNDFMTTRGGTRLATSIEGGLTGRGADLVIIDDPLQPENALSDSQRKKVNNWFDSTLVSRLNNKVRGVIVIIMQRLHLDDLVGHVTANESWEVLSFPAIAEADQEYVYRTPYGIERHQRRAGDLLHPEREPREILESHRRRMTEYHFAGQYQQRPVPLEGGLVKLKWLKYYEQKTLPTGLRIIQSWDTANKVTGEAAYSACTVWGVKDQNVYLLDVLRARLSFPELKKKVKELQRQWQAEVVLIEDQASGTQLISDLRWEGMREIKPITVKDTKVVRLDAQTATIESGFVHLPKNSPWLAEYIGELTTFPSCKYCDQVDSTSQALEWIKQDSQRPRVFVMPLRA